MGGSDKTDSTETKPKTVKSKSKASKALLASEIRAMLADPTDVPAKKPSIGEAHAAEILTNKSHVVKPVAINSSVLRPDPFVVALTSNIAKEVRDHIYEPHVLHE